VRSKTQYKISAPSPGLTLESTFSVVDTGVDRSDQMLFYYTFAWKTVKWWKKLFLHLFDLAAVNAYIVHIKSSKEKMSLEIFYKKVTVGLFASADMEIQALAQTSSSDGRLVGTNHFLYGIPVTQAKPEGKTQHSCRKYNGLCIGQCFDVYHSKPNYWE
jgi:hypothetical protein